MMEDNSFAEWKKRSKLFNAFRDRSIRAGIGLHECCQAAYKAGERKGRKDVEALAVNAIKLGGMFNAKNR
jgi:hypothetical protein